MGVRRASVRVRYFALRLAQAATSSALASSVVSSTTSNSSSSAIFTSSKLVAMRRSLLRPRAACRLQLRGESRIALRGALNRAARRRVLHVLRTLGLLIGKRAACGRGSGEFGVGEIEWHSANFDAGHSAASNQFRKGTGTVHARFCITVCVADAHDLGAAIL